jgi:hypothetical protein
MVNTIMQMKNFEIMEPHKNLSYCTNFNFNVLYKVIIIKYFMSVDILLNDKVEYSETANVYYTVNTL